MTPENSDPSSNGQEKTDQKFHFFHVFRKFIKVHGKHVSSQEYRVYMTYLYFADWKTGIAYPSSEIIADLIGQAGHHHIPSIRAKLIQRGLLEIVADGGGRGLRCAIRVLMPPDEACR